MHILARVHSTQGTYRGARIHTYTHTRTHIMQGADSLRQGVSRPLREMHIGIYNDGTLRYALKGSTGKRDTNPGNFQIIPFIFRNEASRRSFETAHEVSQFARPGAAHSSRSRSAFLDIFPEFRYLYRPRPIVHDSRCSASSLARVTLAVTSEYKFVRAVLMDENCHAVGICVSIGRDAGTNRHADKPRAI